MKVYFVRRIAVLFTFCYKKKNKIASVICSHYIVKGQCARDCTCIIHSCEWTASKYLSLYWGSHFCSSKCPSISVFRNINFGPLL